MVFFKIKFILAYIAVLSCSGCTFEVYDKEFHYTHNQPSEMERFEKERASQASVLSDAQKYYRG